MKNDPFLALRIYFTSVVFLLGSFALFAQSNSDYFAGRWRFGGAIGASFGNQITNLMVAPGAMYPLNDHVGIGLGLQANYIKVRNTYEYFLYGGSALGVLNLSDRIQVSGELEQLRVQKQLLLGTSEQVRDEFWNTALFIGIGYRSGPITAGIRYNLLFDESQQVYSTAYMPFIRLFF
jgi:hypothetical protein